MWVYKSIYLEWWQKKRKEESPEISSFLVLNIFRIFCFNSPSVSPVGLFLSCSLHRNFIQVIDFANQAISMMKTDQACLKAFELDWAKQNLDNELLSLVITK